MRRFRCYYAFIITDIVIQGLLSGFFRPIYRNVLKIRVCSPDVLSRKTSDVRASEYGDNIAIILA